MDEMSSELGLKGKITTDGKTLVITLDPLVPTTGAEPLVFRFEYPIPDFDPVFGYLKSESEISPEVWAQYAQAEIASNIHALAKLLVPLWVQRASVHLFHIKPNYAYRRKLISLVTRHIQHVAGVLEPSKPGPKPKQFTLGQIAAAMRAIAQDGRHVTQASVANYLNVSVSKLERTLRGHGTTFTGVKEKFIRS